ncbi:SusC/RagA family TonB-linked outer membrane protein [Sinomicrobium soli]|uniref:SusC/RagA family TonB-linked outer membrane protein n=1 Tax=Sinomicrobium sp. N-1-3-6 TaxID=2219864 RepID=UPI001374BCE8|nr:SusC/RagA family TonB-linked outer membrane protein [Sinomicrobium sp. N-1-3-6]
MRLFIILFCTITFGFTSPDILAQHSITVKATKTIGPDELFELIMQQTDYVFFYPEHILKGLTPLTLHKGKIKVSELLDRYLSSTDVVYEVDKKVIKIFRKTSSPDTPKQHQRPDSSQQQYLRIGGAVTGSEGEVLPGVNIVVKNTGRGTMSDEAGEYNLRANPNDTLVFTYIGFKKTSIPVNGREQIDVVMQEDIMSLEGVVINAGYYKVKDRERTGNITKVTSKDIENQPVTNPIMALQGRVAGLDITPSSGIAGGAFHIEIRGRNSLSNTNGSRPLIIVDGVPVNLEQINSSNPLLNASGGYDPLSTLDPGNIESMEVLKDADATAIYGSRGANGVVLITTKNNNRKTGTHINVRFSSGIAEVPHRLQLLNSSQYLEMRREAFENAGQEPTAANAPDLMVWDTSRNTDWQKELLGNTANITDFQSRISTGTGNTTFSFGAAYHKENFVFPGDFYYERMNLNFNANHLSENGKFKAVVSGNYGITNNRLFSGQDITGVALNLPPVAPPIYDENGHLNWENNTFNNPLAVLEKKDKNRINNLIFNTNMSYTIWPTLSASISMGYNRLDRKGHTIAPISALNPSNIGPETTGSGEFYVNDRTSWIMEPQLNYAESFGDHALDMLVGTTFQKNSSSYQRIEALGYSSDSQLESLVAASTINYVTDDEIIYKYAAIYAHIGYNYKSRYFVNLTGRRDGSSRFGPNNRFGNFGALGAAWIFSEEHFLRDNAVLNFGKLRMSYGTTGSDNIGDYSYLDLYTSKYYSYLGVTPVSPLALYNADYQWEITRKLEAAAEVSFLNDRIHLETAWYRNRSSNQLVDYRLANTTGFSSVITNQNAVVQNTGWEILLNTRNISGDDFSWMTSFNLTIPRNKLIAFPDFENSSYASVYEIGQPLSLAKLYRFKGVNPDTGVYEVEDANADGVIDNNDRVVYQNTGRKFYGGLQNTFRYKDFELNVLLQYSRQVNRTPVSLIGMYAENYPVRILDRWQAPGDDASFQKYSSDSSIVLPWSYASQSTFGFVDNSFVRLKTLNLTYHVPGKIKKSLKLKSAKVYLQGQNLLTFTKSGDYQLDPETNNGFPPLRMMLLGIDVNF